jgi:DNA-binding winged helix-turn-helix (wHTH) protein
VVDVSLVHWPAEADRLERLRARGEPRLVVVEQGPPPTTDDWLEDWLRTPVDEDEVRIRLETLRTRARNHTDELTLEDGVLRAGRHVVVLPPIQARLATALLERRNAVVSRETLLRRGWPEEKPTDRNVLDVHLARLRRLLAGTDLEIRTVHRRGYLLRSQEASDRGAGTPLVRSTSQAPSPPPSSGEATRRLSRSEPTNGDE